MRTTIGPKQRILVLMGLGIAIAMSGLAAPAATPALPDAVSKAFQANFPQGKITNVEKEFEDGVTVYAIDFMDGKTEKTADIAADGTVAEIGVVILAKDVPDAAMKTILKEAAGAKIGEIERVEVTHESRNGALQKLPAAVIHYEVELTKKNSEAEMVVSADGTVLE